MRIPLIGNIINRSRNIIFPGSVAYWENRYRKNGNSGAGSYGKNATYKTTVLNQFVKENEINSVIEFGCGDGNQAKQFNFPSYIGLDVSTTAIEKCSEMCKSDPAKQFFIAGKITTKLKAELAISLDVIYHLIEEEVYERYMKELFASATRYVIIYAWDVESEKKYHVKHRKFTGWIEENIVDFCLVDEIKSDSFSDFYIYKRK